MTECIHAGCSNKEYQKKEALNNEYSLCKYHYRELVNNGHPGFWDCDWCRDFKQQIHMLEHLDYNAVSRGG